jgi:predicted transcriptional regulator
VSKNNREGISKAIPVKLNPELLKKIQSLAKTMGEPQSTVMRMAMRVGLPILEKTFQGSHVDLSALMAAAKDEAKYPSENLSPAILNEKNLRHHAKDGSHLK